MTVARIGEPVREVEIPAEDPAWTIPEPEETPATPEPVAVPA